MFCFFFVKQKTAYEMRISDWSSDVCSSDLARGGRSRSARHGRVARRVARRSDNELRHARAYPALAAIHATSPFAADRFRHRGQSAGPDQRSRRRSRSEEHTSELQSLMRISYAVFCLKKKTAPNNINIRHKNTI